MRPVLHSAVSAGKAVPPDKWQFAAVMLGLQEQIGDRSLLRLCNLGMGR